MKVFICHTNYHLSLVKLLIKELELDELIILTSLSVTDELKQFTISPKLNSKKFLEMIFLEKEEVTELYVANAKKLSSRFLVKILGRKAKVYTFDDGIGSMCGEGYFYTNDHNKFKKFLLKILGERQYLDFVKNRVLMHYTIYKFGNAPCSLPTRVLELKPEIFGCINNLNDAMDNKGLIILGSAYVEDNIISLEKYLDLISFVLEHFKCSNSQALYYAHPREDVEKLKEQFYDLDIMTNIGPSESFVLSARPSAKIVGIASSSTIHIKCLGYDDVFNLNPFLSKAKVRDFFTGNGVEVIDAQF